MHHLLHSPYRRRIFHPGPQGPASALMLQPCTCSLQLPGLYYIGQPTSYCSLLLLLKQLPPKSLRPLPHQLCSPFSLPTVDSRPFTPAQHPMQQLLLPPIRHGVFYPRLHSFAQTLLLQPAQHTLPQLMPPGPPPPGPPPPKLSPALKRLPSSSRMFQSRNWSSICSTTV